MIGSYLPDICSNESSRNGLHQKKAAGTACADTWTIFITVSVLQIKGFSSQMPHNLPRSWLVKKKEKNPFKACFSFGFWLSKGSLSSQVPELVTKILILILKAEPRDEVPASVRETSPLVVGLSVFLITRKLDINLGMKGWAELCLLLSSETTTDNRILEELPVLVPNAQQWVGASDSTNAT